MRKRRRNLWSHLLGSHGRNVSQLKPRLLPEETRERREEKINVLYIHSRRNCLESRKIRTSK